MILMQMPAVINEIARASERCLIDDVRSSSRTSRVFRVLDFCDVSVVRIVSASCEIRKHCIRKG